MCHDCNPSEGFPPPNYGFPGDRTQYALPYQQQYQPHYDTCYGPYGHPGFGPRYGFQNPPPPFQQQFQQHHRYHPQNPTPNEGRIAVTNNNCGDATTSNFGNTTMTNCGSNHQGNHHAENYGHMQTLNEQRNRTTRVGNVSSNGGNASANTTSGRFMTNAKVKGGTNHSSGFQCSGSGGAVNIGRGY